MKFEQIIARGLELGLEAVEIYASTSESNTIKVDEGNLESYNVKKLFGVSIRGLLNGKMGYVYTETLDDDTMEILLQQLLENVKLISSTEEEFMYASGATYQEVPNLESDYKNYSTAEKVAMLQDLEKKTLAVSPKIVKVGYCQYSETSQKVQIMNSKGLDLSRSYSYTTTIVGPLAAEGDQTAMGFAGDINPFFQQIEKDRIIKEATEAALAQLGAGFVKTGKYPVVFKRDVATELLSAFSSVFTGEAALKKMTILADKVGEKIFGDNITIMDDPFYDDALVKSSFDDEGVPCKTKAVVEKGVFNGLLHSLKTAHYFHVAPTGNGFKMSTAGSISTEPTNLFIKEGNLSKDEIISTVEEGIYITEVNGLHAGLNPISGDFNVQSSGYMIKNGKIDKPITLFVTSGNFFEMMKNIEAIGNDIEKRFVGVASPTLKVKSLAISGKWLIKLSFLKRTILFLVVFSGQDWIVNH